MVTPSFVKSSSIGIFSKHHFTIERTASGSRAAVVTITDFSRNGVFVNGVKAPPNEPMTLLSRSRIALCDAAAEALEFIDFTAEEEAVFPIAMSKRYRSILKLGAGAFGQVHLGYSLRENRAVAVKSLAVPPEQHGPNEAALLDHIQHSNVIKVFQAFQQANRLHLVLEFACGGDLFARINRNAQRPSSS